LSILSINACVAIVACFAVVTLLTIFSIFTGWSGWAVEDVVPRTEIIETDLYVGNLSGSDRIGSANVGVTRSWYNTVEPSEFIEHSERTGVFKIVRGIT